MMSNIAFKSDRTYTYADYLGWPAEERWEVIHGIPYAMSQGPDRQHQEISRNLLIAFGNYLKSKKCQVYAAPFAVRLPQASETEKTTSTVIQPDITIVCDPDKLDHQGCKGAPDLIVEILSRSTASHDVIRKRKLYEANGVLEYWIVDPLHQITARFYLSEELSEYRAPDYFAKDDIISPIIFPELKIDLNEIFPATEEQD